MLTFLFTTSVQVLVLATLVSLFNLKSNLQFLDEEGTLSTDFF